MIEQLLYTNYSPIPSSYMGYRLVLGEIKEEKT